MRGELAGKTAIVTGGASGIGRAAVELFAREGAQVVIADVDAGRGEALAAELGGGVHFRATDVADAAEVQALVDFTVATCGGLQVMFNNAGVSSRLFASFLDDDLAEFDRIMGVNLRGVMLGTQRAARHMAEHGGGSIINTASIGGAVAGVGVISYRASKAAVLHFTRCAAIDLGPHGIRVNAINPGHIRTPMSSWAQNGMSEAGFQQLQRELDDIQMAEQPLKRRGSPEDVAQAALYLASDHSIQVTAQVIAVDGGATAGSNRNQAGKILDAQARAAQA